MGGVREDAYPWCQHWSSFFQRCCIPAIRMEKPECGRSLLAPEAVPRNRFDHVYLCIKMNHHHALQKAIYPIMQKHIANAT